MFVLEFEQVEVDYCYECGGVWLDSGELEIIGQKAGSLEGRLLGALEKGEGGRRAGESRRRCPVCRKLLAEVTADTDPPIVLDRCPAEHGLWFDQGELRAVVRAAGADEGNVLSRFLGELGASHAQPEDPNGRESGR
jgi:Zn-finger nucleic acid-binding protein